MNGEEVDVQIAGIGNRAFDRVADIELLHIQEHALALTAQAARKIQATCKQKL